MQLAGEYTFRAPLNAVWDALMDPTVLAQALPGGEALQQVGDNEYQAVMNVRVGPVQGRFEGRIELADIEPYRGYRMKVTGQGAPGFVNGEGVLALEAVQDEAGAEAVLLTYKGDVQVGGKIAGVSQRLVESSAKSLTRQGLQALERQLAAPAVPTAEPVAHAADGLPAAEGVAVVQAVSAAGRQAEVVLGAPAWQPVSTRRTVATPAPANSTGAGNVMLTTARDVASDLASDYLTPVQQERGNLGGRWCAGYAALCGAGAPGAEALTRLWESSAGARFPACSGLTIGQTHGIFTQLGRTR